MAELRGGHDTGAPDNSDTADTSDTPVRDSRSDDPSAGSAERTVDQAEPSADQIATAFADAVDAPVGPPEPSDADVDAAFADAVDEPDDVTRAREEVDRAFAVEDARGQVAEALEQSPSFSADDFESKAGAWSELQARPDAGDVRTEAENDVVANAKQDLLDRERSGEVLGGDPVGRADQWHQQGRNDRGFQSDCALACTSEVLRDCGVDVSEHDVVESAVATGRCDASSTVPHDNGAVYGAQPVKELLEDHGVSAIVEHPQDAPTLAAWVDQGHGVVAEVNAGELWDSADPRDYGSGQVNHAVVVTGTTRDTDGELTGFVVNDPGRHDGAGVVVPMEQWQRSWGDDGVWWSPAEAHETVVTLQPTVAERNDRS